MTDMLKLIIKQNMATHKLLQCVLFYLGISQEGIEKTLKDIQKEVDKEMEEN